MEMVEPLAEALAREPALMVEARALARDDDELFWPYPTEYCVLLIVTHTLPESYVVAPASCPPVRVGPELLLEKDGLLKSAES